MNCESFSLIGSELPEIQLFEYVHLRTGFPLIIVFFSTLAFSKSVDTVSQKVLNRFISHFAQTFFGQLEFLFVLQLFVVLK